MCRTRWGDVDGQWRHVWHVTRWWTLWHVARWWTLGHVSWSQWPAGILSRVGHPVSSGVQCNNITNDHIITRAVYHKMSAETILIINTLLTVSGRVISAEAVLLWPGTRPLAMSLCTPGHITSGKHQRLIFHHVKNNKFSRIGKRRLTE